MAAKSAARAIGSQVGREIIRGVLGSILGGGRRRLVPASPARRNVWLGIACALVGSIAFSGKPVLVKAAYQYGVDTTTLLALRMLFAAPLFAMMAWWAGRMTERVTPREIGGLAALGFIGYYLGSFLDLAGLQYISAGFGRLILYLYPTLVLLLSAAFLRQPLRSRQLASLALSYAGIAMVFSAEARLGTDRMLTALGAMLVYRQRRQLRDLPRRRQPFGAQIRLDAFFRLCLTDRNGFCHRAISRRPIRCRHWWSMSTSICWSPYWQSSPPCCRCG